MERERNKLDGELGALKSQLKETESKCENDFQCKLPELPGFIDKLRVEMEVAISNAEILLGLKEGTVTVAEKVVEKSVPPKEESRAKKMVALENEDEDGLLG
jgi:hypothetical protein